MQLPGIARLGGGLPEDEAILIGKLLRLLRRDVALAIKIALVTDEEDNRIGVGQVSRVREPALQVIVRAAPTWVTHGPGPNPTTGRKHRRGEKEKRGEGEEED